MFPRSLLYLLLSTLALAIIPAVSAQSFVFSPSTTVTQESSNNTSAADTFAAQSNSDAAAGNVSKQPIRSLLYTGATTRIYAHFLPWFGQPSHMDVGYSSDTVEQVKRQVEDMQSRGIQ